VYIESGKMIDHEKLIECESFLPEDVEREVENLMNNHHRIKLLKLKVNTKVMCVQNIDVESGICNGSIGIVIKFQSEHLGGKEYPVVKFSNGVTMLMKPQPIQSEIMPNVVITQIPLIKAWALTIHKMQGATLESAEMDIGKSIFEKGQVYVALSRVKSLEGLYIKSLAVNRIETSEKVHNYMNKIIDSYRK
jgi:ATP-dependent DNA helicase PIF1